MKISQYTWLDIAWVTDDFSSTATPRNGLLRVGLEQVLGETDF